MATRTDESIYITFAATAWIAALVLVPGMLRQLQLIDRDWAETVMIPAFMFLAIPWFIAVAAAIVLTIVCLFKASKSLLLRLASWYLLGAGPTVIGAKLLFFRDDAAAQWAGAQPISMTPDLVFGAIFIAAGVVFGCSLPLRWWMESRTRAIRPTR